MAPTFHYSPAFIESARELSVDAPLAWAGLTAAIDYLRQFQRAAVAPDVKWHIIESEFTHDCGEIRWPAPEDQSEHPDLALRGLFVAHPTNEWFVFTVLGNKATGPHRGNAWYDVAVPQSDGTVRQALAALELTPFQ